MTGPQREEATPIVLKHVSDAVSVWRTSNGSLVNRWDRMLAEAIFNMRDIDVPELRRRRDLTQQWIDVVLRADAGLHEHFPMPVDGHGNGPVDEDHWDHDACSCGHPSYATCTTRLHAAGQPCEDENCIDCDPDWQVEP